MPLINCKVGLKCRWAKHYVLPLVGVENNNADVCSCCHFISKKLGKGFERSVYGDEYKT